MNMTTRRRAGRLTDSEIATLLEPYDTVALVLQGGGALGAYQAGVFEALAEAGIAPRWFSGVSIGAINAAIIAGNRPEHRLDRLREFWNLLTGWKVWLHTPEGHQMRALRNQSSAMMTMMFGLPGFFNPWPVNPWFQPTGAQAATSFYDTSELRRTLERLVDWDIVNGGDVRLSVGAVNVRTGNFRYFDTACEVLGPEHIMASGALPPAFAPVHIDNEDYWDGGIVSNTPLQYLLDCDDLRDTLAFQVDLFSARGAMPGDMPAVLARHKDIMYSSRTRNSTDTFRRMHNYRLRLRQALLRVPEEARTAEDRAFLAETDDVAQVNIVHLIYQQRVYEGHAKDAEFSGTSMKEHWASGLADTRRTLHHSKWLEIPSETVGMTVHDIHRDDPT